MGAGLCWDRVAIGPSLATVARGLMRVGGACGRTVPRVRRAGLVCANMAAAEAGATQAGSAPAEPELEPLRLRRLRGDGFFEIPAADRVSAAVPGGVRGFGAGTGSPLRSPRGGAAWTRLFAFSWDGAAA